jgi:hypothetical protein
MKDFYVLSLLSRQFDFDGTTRSQAVANTFAHRNTLVPSELPEALQHGFGLAKQAQWQTFLATGEIVEGPHDMGVLLDKLRGFLGPVLRAVSFGKPISSRWKAPGPWPS